jgi:ribosome-associated toxin RatA of RatAB toxin-antitoxin module
MLLSALLSLLAVGPLADAAVVLPPPASGPAAPAAPRPPPLPAHDPVTNAKVRSGLVITQAKEGDQGGEVSGWAVAKCPPEAVFAVLTHHADFTEFMPRLKSIEVLGRTETGERAVQIIDASVQDVKYGLDYTWQRDALRVDFRLAEDLPHDVKAVQGHWQLWPLDGGKSTLLEYGTVVEVGRYVPGFIRSYLADRGAKDTIDAIRKRSEARHALAQAAK